MKKTLSILLALTIIIGAIAPTTVNATEITREDLFYKIQDRISSVANPEDVADAISIFWTIVGKKTDIFKALPHQEYLTAKGITENIIDDVLNVLINSSILIQGMILDSDLKYADAKDDIDNLLMELYELSS